MYRKFTEAKITLNSEVYTGTSAGLFRGFDFDGLAYIGRAEGSKSFFGCISKLVVNQNELDFGMLDTIGISKCGIN
jgi:hypothetical protein